MLCSLDMLDRGDCPSLPEGYCLRLAVSCTLQFVWSLQRIVSDQSTEKPLSEIEKKLVEYSWCGLLPTLSMLLEAW